MLLANPLPPSSGIRRRDNVGPKRRDVAGAVRNHLSMNRHTKEKSHTKSNEQGMGLDAVLIHSKESLTSR
jgi:hypothetical protein